MIDTETGHEFDKDDFNELKTNIEKYGKSE